MSFERRLCKLTVNGQEIKDITSWTLSFVRCPHCDNRAELRIDGMTKIITCRRCQTETSYESIWGGSLIVGVNRLPLPDDVMTG